VSEYYSVRETCEGDEQYRINITVDKQSLSMFNCYSEANRAD
jgi:hypothetical protein